ncbi:hypothetical protein GI364_17810 [Alicyclobacillus sp. SO9]|nr:hypothetical protein GI364_17810 [Alicyclobacillus sp. SO9]
MSRIASIEWMILTIWILAFAYYAMNPISDPDTPWHLATGRYILFHHYVPTHDVFSWSMRGTPWVTQEWMFEVVFAWLVLHFKYFGAWLLYAGLHTLTIIVLYRLAVHVSDNNRVISAVVAGGGTLAALDFWTLRPQIFSYLMFAVFLLILQKVREGQFLVLWAVPPLIMLWANTHGSSTIGIFVCLLEVLVSFIPSFGRFRRVPLPRGARWRLVVAPLAGALLGLVNPNGIKAYTYALLGTNQTLVNNIMEWHSPNFHSFDFKYGVLPFLIAVFLIVLASKRPIPMREVLFFGGSFAVTLVYQRFLPYLTITTVPLLAYVMSDWIRSLNSLRRWMMVSNAVIIAAALGLFVTQVPRLGGSFNKHMSTSAYPVGAANYLLSHPQYHLLNAYNFGGYFIYRGIPTFVDGRTGIFLHKNLFSNYLALQNLWWNAPQLLQKYKIGAVVFPSGNQLITYLSNEPNWKIVYTGSNAEILVKKQKSSS